MARIRTIKPEFPQSETIGELSREARLLFILIWTVADDAGRFRAASRMLASLLYPYDDDAPALIDGWLDELESQGCVRRYVVDGSTYGEIVNWLKHQKIDKPSASRLPEFREGSRKFAKPRESSRSLGDGPRTLDHGPGTMDQDHGSGVVGGAGAPIPAAAVAALIAGPLFKQFADAYPGPIGGAERLFVAMVKRGENVDPIIAAARGADKSVPADRWLDARGWEAAPKPAPDKPAAAKQTAECTISPEAFALADKLAGIAGQDPEFLEPGWCGAAWRCQQWLNEGYPPDLIEAGIKSMVAAKRGQKIGSISYFEKGLARFIAEHTKPVPNVVELKAETVEVKRESNWRDREDRKSGLAAIDRVYDRIEAEMQRRDGTREAEDKRR